MIEGLKPYPEYKESGVPWLGRVPKPWAQIALGTIGHPKSDRNPGGLPLLSVFLDRGVIPYGQGGKRVHAPSLDLSNYQVVAPGDFVLNNQQAWRGSVGVSHHHGIVSPAYIVLRLSSEIEPRYADYLFRCPRMVDQFVVASKGVGDIQRQIYWPYLKRVQVPLPTRGEQSAIVRFLDHATRRIDAYIRAKRKLIALLNEQKQAIIHRAVTRGLDPNVKMKDSGVPWLGQVPEHWEVRRLSTVARLIVSNVDKHSVAGEASVRLCNYVDVYRNECIVQSLPFMAATATPDELARFRIRVGDVIVTKDSEDWQDIGVPSLVRYESDDLVCGYHLAILRPKTSTISGEFLLRVLQDPWIAVQWHVQAKGVTRYGLSQGAIKSLMIPLPQLEEQRRIADAIAEECRAIDRARMDVEHEITLLREYRTRLIADVVTGQLDVREAAKNLPDELPDEPDLDDTMETDAFDEDAPESE